MSKGPDIEGEIDVDIDADVDIDGSNINVGLGIGGLDNINVGATVSVPDPLHMKSELILPQPLQTRSEMAVTQPIVTDMKTDVTMDSDMTIDMKPMVVDLCLTLSVGKLPRTCVRRDYDRHMGLTFFGVEVVGFNRSGTSQFTLDELAPRSHVELGKPTHGKHAPGRGGRGRPTVIDGEGGLTIRLGD